MPKKTTPNATEPQTQPVQEPTEAPLTPTPEQPVTAEATAGMTAPVEGQPDQPKPDNEISFDEPVSAADLTAGSGDTPDAAIPLLTEEQLANLQRAANNDNTKRDFTLKVLAAREAHKPQPDALPPPLAPRMAEQTNAEIAAGRAMNAHHEALHAKRPAPVPEQSSQAVFRPADYVPNQKKGQGYVQGRGI